MRPLQEEDSWVNLLRSVTAKQLYKNQHHRSHRRECARFVPVSLASRRRASGDSESSVNAGRRAPRCCAACDSNRTKPLRPREQAGGGRSSSSDNGSQAAARRLGLVRRTTRRRRLKEQCSSGWAKQPSRLNSGGSVLWIRVVFDPRIYGFTCSRTRQWRRGGGDVGRRVRRTQRLLNSYRPLPLRLLLPPANQPQWVEV